MTATGGGIERVGGRLDGGEDARRAPRARIAIYARSSGSRPGDLIDEQIRRCRHHAAGLGGDVVEVFHEFAASGAARARPGLDSHMAGAASFDVVLVASPDRLGRDRTAVAAIHDRLASLGVALATVSGGVPDAIRATPLKAS